MYPDDLYDIRKEQLTFLDDYPIRLCHCGKRIFSYAYDNFGNAVYENQCYACSEKQRLGTINQDFTKRKEYVRTECMYCHKQPNLPGMAWCADCAIKTNEKLRGTKWPSGEPISDDLIDNRIKLFNKLRHNQTNCSDKK